MLMQIVANDNVGINGNETMSLPISPL